MHFIQTLYASLLLVGGALAQSGSVVVHVVTVSSSDKNTLTFSPQNVAAQPGEMVQFQFRNGNHTVVQSTFGQPCIPINNVMSNVTGFFAGFQDVPQGASSIPTYTVMVNDTKPVWYYCAQGKHCQMGMVGAINAATTGNKTVGAFAALAAQAPQNLAPGQSSSNSSSGYGSGYGSAPSSAPPTMTTSVTAGSSTTSATTTSSSAVSTGAASGSLFASQQQVLVCGFAAALLSAVLL